MPLSEGCDLIVHGLYPLPWETGVVYHDLSPLSEGCQLIVHDLYPLPWGHFVMCHDFLPLKKVFSLIDDDPKDVEEGLSRQVSGRNSPQRGVFALVARPKRPQEKTKCHVS